MKKRFIIISSLFFLLVAPVAAQVAQFDIAQTIKIADEGAKSGDIVSFTDQVETLILSKTEYDQRMYGVLVADPIVVYETTADIPVVRSGVVEVNVTDVNGPIAIGDYITASAIPGKAMKGEASGGYMLGVAMSAFAGTGGTEIETSGKKVKSGVIIATIGIGPAGPVLIKAGGGLWGTLKFYAANLGYNLGMAKNLDRVIRYVMSALVALLFLLIAFWIFGRAMVKGIEAMGRNPLARAQIQTMIVINGVLLLLVTLAGIILGVVILSV